MAESTSSPIPPKVSVALRSYNQREYLKEAIESILIQDYAPLEIVVGDDGSTDGSREMLLDYDRNHPGLFQLIFNKRNLGFQGNGNVIQKACTGKYIAWLDGDDLFLPGKIKKQVEVMEKHPECVICFHNAEIFFESDPKKVQKIYGDGPGELVPREGGVEILFEQTFYIIPSVSMTRRNACPQWDVRIRNSSDVLFMIETAMKGKIIYIPEILARYRRHDLNVTNLQTLEDYKVNMYLVYSIIDAKYPEYSRLTRAARKLDRDVYHAAVKNAIAKKRKEARILLLESLRQGWVSWKWLGWYMKSFF